MRSTKKSLTSKSSSTLEPESTLTSSPTGRMGMLESSFTATSDSRLSATVIPEIQLSIKMPSLIYPKDFQTLCYAASWLFAKGERLLRLISGRNWGLTGDLDVSLILQVRVPDGFPHGPRSTTLGKTF